MKFLHVITSRLTKYDERARVISHTETATSISQEGTRYTHQGESRWCRRVPEEYKCEVSRPKID